MVRPELAAYCFSRSASAPPHEVKRPKLFGHLTL